MDLKRYSTIGISTLAGIMLLAHCKSSSNLATAQKSFDNKEYAVALPQFRNAFAASKTKAEKEQAALRTADTYVYLDDAKNAEAWYRKVLSMDANSTEAMLGEARALKGMEKYKEAIIAYQAYEKKAGESEQVKKEIAGCEEAEKWRSSKTRYVVVNEKSLNTEYADYAAAYGRKGTLYFTSDRAGGFSNETYEYTGKMYSDIYQVTFRKNSKAPNEPKYDKAIALQGVNTKYNDGVTTYEAKTNRMVYTICNDKNGKGNSCKLYTSTYDGTQWSDPEVLPFCADSFNTGQPALSKDGTELYFASDRPGGYGGKDLYVVSYNKKTKAWGEPKNLGAQVNTDMDEVFPFIHQDGMLFFSSNGHKGMGRLDVFCAKRSGDDWGTPVNLKAPVNSGGDDFCFVADEFRETGYLSSNRDGGRGKDDIYRFYLIPLKFTLSGIVYDQKTGKPVSNSQVALYGTRDTVKIKTDEKGYYHAPVMANSDYSLLASKAEDYYLDSKPEALSTRGLENPEDFTRNLYLDPLNLEDEFTLQGIYYDVDKWDLRESSKPVLDTLVQLLGKYPRIKIEIGSHTDCRSDSAYNKQLSEKRAQSVVDYLVQNKISRNRLEARGYGESRPVNDCSCEGTVISRACSEEEYQRNRRTTFKILSKNYNGR